SRRVVTVARHRPASSAESAAVGLDDSPERAVTLLEWPDRAAGYLAGNRLDITFALEPQAGLTARNVRITGYGSFGPRTERVLTIPPFLDRSEFGRAD